MRMDDNADAKRILLASPPADWRRQLGRPRITWLSTIQQDLKHHHLTLPEAADLAQNRPLWRTMSTYGATQSWVACQKRRRVFFQTSDFNSLFSLLVLISKTDWHLFYSSSIPAHLNDNNIAFNDIHGRVTLCETLTEWSLWAHIPVTAASVWSHHQSQVPGSAAQNCTSLNTQSILIKLCSHSNSTT